MLELAEQELETRDGRDGNGRRRDILEVGKVFSRAATLPSSWLALTTASGTSFGAQRPMLLFRFSAAHHN